MWTLLLVACAGDKGIDSAQGDDTAGTDSTQGDDTGGTTASGEVMTSVQIVESENNPLAALVTVAVATPAAVEIRWSCAGWSGSDDAEISDSGVLEIWGVGQQTDCDIEAEAAPLDGSASETLSLAWTSGALPDISLSLTTSGATTGLTLLSAMTEGGPGGGSSFAWYGLGIDPDGEIVWTYTGEVGEVREQYVRDMGDGTVTLMIDGEARRISMAGQTLSSVTSSQLTATHHDNLPLPDGSALFLTNESQTVTYNGADQTAVGDAIVRVDAAGDVVWEWSAFDHLDTTRFPGELAQGQALGGGGLDWTHGNAIALAPDGEAVLYSSRSQSWIVRIDLDTGDIDWIFGQDGDFALTDGEWFYNQHAPEMQADGTLLLYDNGNERPTGQTTRAARYQLDTSNMTAEQIFSYEAESFTARVGDANLNDSGGYLVTVGSPDRDDAYVIELDSAGDEAWRVTVSGGDLYRAERMAW